MVDDVDDDDDTYLVRLTFFDCFGVMSTDGPSALADTMGVCGCSSTFVSSDSHEYVGSAKFNIGSKSLCTYGMSLVSFSIVIALPAGEAAIGGDIGASIFNADECVFELDECDDVVDLLLIVIVSPLFGSIIGIGFRCRFLLSGVERCMVDGIENNGPAI